MGDEVPTQTRCRFHDPRCDANGVRRSGRRLFSATKHSGRDCHAGAEDHQSPGLRALANTQAQHKADGNAQANREAYRCSDTKADCEADAGTDYKADRRSDAKTERESSGHFNADPF